MSQRRCSLNVYTFICTVHCTSKRPGLEWHQSPSPPIPFWAVTPTFAMSPTSTASINICIKMSSGWVPSCILENIRQLLLPIWFYQVCSGAVWLSGCAWTVFDSFTPSFFWGFDGRRHHLFALLPTTLSNWGNCEPSVNVMQYWP